jgi:hypothetical protein
VTGPARAADPDAVYDAFARSVTAGQIDLYASAQREDMLAGLRPALAALRIGGSYILTGAELTRGTGTVVLAGSGSFGLPGADAANVVPVRTRLVYSVADGHDRFELTLNVTSPHWTFRTTFPVLPVCQMAQPNGAVVLKESFLSDLVMDTVAFTAAAVAETPATAELSGRLYPVSVLEPYADFFAPWPLSVGGEVTLPADAATSPMLDLSAGSARDPIVIGPVSLSEFRLSMRVYLNPDRQDAARDRSILEFLAELHLGEGGIASGTASVQPLASAQVWMLAARFPDEAVSLGAGLAQVAALFGLPGSDLALVPGLDQIAGFFISEMTVGLRTPWMAGVPRLEGVSVTLGSKHEWRPPIPYLTVSDVGMGWRVGWFGGLTPSSISGAFFGSVEVGPDDLPAAHRPGSDEPVLVLDVTAYFPSWAVEGVMREAEIPLDHALLYFFGVTGPESSLEISALQFNGNPRTQTFEAAADVVTPFKVPLLGGVSLALVDVTLNVSVEQGAVRGGIEAIFAFTGAAPGGQPDPVFYLAAEYNDVREGWVFSGGLYPDSVVELVALIAKFAGREPPDWARRLTLTVERLDLSFATGSKAYSISGTIVGDWQIDLFGAEQKFAASASVDLARAAERLPVTGRLAGTFAVNKIAVSAAANLLATGATYELAVDFGGIRIEAVTGWRGTGQQRHLVISFQVGGVTLGDMVEYLAGLAAPTLGVRLEPPWDLLGRIELSRFVVTIDPTDRAVELTYRADAGLPGMTVETVGLRYQPLRGRPSVTLILTGDILGTGYREKPLSWDVLSGSPPAVPGKGNQLLDLRYLGIGQRITFKDRLPATVQETVNELATKMRFAEPDRNPLREPGGSGMRFAADSQWLIGLAARIADTLDLAIVFNDPRLYGLSVALAGERAGGLAGLSFEILYKRISDDVGVFRVELRVPDQFRRLQLGAVSVTLGIIVVEIYTNGNFLVDLGFPHQRNFSRSFTVEVAPFIGRGGIYFGVLDGTTSSRVPAITNGTFSPVIALGVGLSIGVGKEVRAGPLSGGAYLEVIGIFEGVFGWFNPANAGSAPDRYYWVQAFIAIHGKVYGTIDFAIIQVSVTIEAWAQASVVLEAYRAALLRLSASVRVSASVKILFIRVSFEFSASIDLAFTVGSDQPTPWILGPGQGRPDAARLRGNILPPLRRRPDRQRALLAAHLAATAETSDPDWDPTRKVFPDSPRAADITMLPVLSLTDVPVSWTREPDAGAEPPAYRVAFCLFAPDGTKPVRPGQPPPPRSADMSARAAKPEQLSASLIIESLLRWAISSIPAIGGSATVTAVQLARQLDFLAGHAAEDGPFSVDSLATFFDTNLHLGISGDPEASGGPKGPESEQEPGERGGMVMPMPPFLSRTSPQAGDWDFAACGEVGPLYAWGAGRYAAQFSPSSRPRTPPPPDDPDDYQPMAGYVFSDWCLMVARSALQAAADAMSGWRQTITAQLSLADVARLFPSITVDYAVQAGDTLDNVAAALGASPDELTFLNSGLADAIARAEAGHVLAVRLGVSPEAVAGDCARTPLAAFTATLGTLDYQATQTDTLAGVATRFGLAGAINLFARTPAGTLADEARLLRPRATFGIPEITQPWDGALPLAAATYFCRYNPGSPDTVTEATWYIQAVADLNQGVIEGAGALVPVGTPMSVPRSLYSTETERYVSLPGDTVGLIGAALALAQNYASGEDGPEGWPDFRNGVRPAPGGVIIPASATSVLSGETVNRLAQRTIAHAGDLAGLLGWIAGAQILRPLALIPVPSATLPVAAGETLDGLSARTGLTLADLATRIGGQPILPGSPEHPLTVTIAHLPVQHVEDLVGAVMAGDAPADISGLSSRQLLSGLRLPAPEPDEQGHLTPTGPSTPLYELTGQMFPGPVPDPDPEHSGQDALQVTFTVNPGTGWISLNRSAVAGPDDTVEDLLARFPDLARLNPALVSVPGRLRTGLIYRTGTDGTLEFTYTNAGLAAGYPATALTITPVHGPAAMALAETVPRTYGLDNRITLQAPTELPVPVTGQSPLSGAVSAWPFPAALLALATAGTTTRYDVMNPGNTEIVADTTFAAMLGFGVRRLSDLPHVYEADQPHVYELIGADTAGRDLALTLWRYLRTAPAGSRAFIAVQPPPDAAITSGLAILTADEAATFLVKTNQSTESVPPPRTTGPDIAAADDPSYANLADLAAFCLLLWEGSVVGGTGYYLGFSTVTGDDLPAGAFDDQGVARLWLLIIPGEQQQNAPDGRALLPVNTCVLAAATLDPAASSLFVEAAEDPETTVEPAVPPGTAGFTLTLRNPGEGADAETRLRRLFSLARYAIPASDRGQFALADSGLPAGPQESDGQQLPLWLRERRRRWRRAGRNVAADPEPDYWNYGQALPVSRYTPHTVTPDIPGLPGPGADPYRGIAGETIPVAGIQLGFADVLGNVTAPPAAEEGLVLAEVGYTDALLGVAAWPAATLSYRISRAGDGQIMLTMTVAPQPAATAAMPGTSAAQAIAAAARQAERYREAYYQLSAERADAAVLTTLRQTADGRPEPLPADVAPLWRYAAAAYAAASAAASTYPAATGGRLALIASGYGVSLDEIAATNLDRPVRELFGMLTPVIPAFVVFPAGATAATIVAADRPGWPNPPDGAALLRMPQNSTGLPLRPGVLLATPARTVPVPPGEPGPTLAELAGQAKTEPGQLAEDNAADQEILRPGFVFEFDGWQVPVPSGPFSLRDVQGEFARMGIVATVAELAVQADRPGMFAPGERLTSRHYLTGDDDTLDDNDGGFTAVDLAGPNATTPDLFDAGALLYLGTFEPGQAGPRPGETLGDYAARFGCPPALLLAANADAELPDQAVIIPGANTLPGTVRVPFTLAADDILSSVAGRFATTAEDLGRANAAMPGTLTADRTVTVTVDGETVSARTEPGDSLDAVRARLAERNPRVTIEAVITAIAGSPAYLAAGGLLICPPAALPTPPGAPAGQLISPRDAAAAYGLTATSFAQANAGTQGLIGPGKKLTDPRRSAEVTTSDADTFNSIASKFAEQQVSLDVADVIAANETTEFLRCGAAALLPPAPARITVSLGKEPGPLAEPVFPLSVTLRLTRPAALIGPGFRTPDGSGPAERADSAIPPSATAQGRDTAATLTLTAFAAEFNAVFPELRLGTARVPEGDDGGVAPDVWVVDFRQPGGISQVEVAPGVPIDGSDLPRYFALRPLFNYLVTRLGVPVRSLQPDGTLSAATIPTDFQAVDTEVWARRMLADVDLFLSAAYATGLYADAAARPALGRVLTAKKTLTGAVADGLMTVLDVPDPRADAGLDAAIDALGQELAISMAAAYDVAAVVQYDAQVTSPWTRGPPLAPARLFGTAQPVTDGPAGSAAGQMPYTLTAAKTALDKQQSFVTFLMRVPDPGHHGAVAVNLDYAVSDLEFGIERVPDIDGYEDSRWLSFYPPLVGRDKPLAVSTGLGAAVVPVPLRAYPALPVILGQTATASARTRTPSLAGCRLWTYSLSYAHQHAEQDEILVTASFNVPKEQQAVADEPDDVATALAKYISVAGGLWALLAHYVGAPHIPPPAAAAAAGSFADLVEEVTDRWDEHWQDHALDGPAQDGPARDAPAPRSYEFRVRVDYVDLDGESFLDTVTLEAPGTDPVQFAAWPQISCRRPDGGSVGLRPDGEPSERRRVYRVPREDLIPAGEPPSFTLSWPDLPIAEFQNARAELSVRRNQRLLLDGPATREEFVYQTPRTQAPAPVVPLLDWPDAVDITDLGEGDIASALREAFSQLCSPSPGLPATVGIRYGHPLALTTDPAQTLSAFVPVYLAPTLTLDADTAEQIAVQIVEWTVDHTPAVVPGRSWAFSVTIYSQLESAGRQPLLSLDQLVYRITEG